MDLDYSESTMIFNDSDFEEVWDEIEMIEHCEKIEKSQMFDSEYDDQLYDICVLVEKTKGSDMSWMGPARGCESNQGAGEVAISCSLKSGNLTINVNRPASWLMITCEENSSFSCSELEESRSYINEYIKVNQHTDKRISFLDIYSCVLPKERLVCLLDLINASSTELLRLVQCKGQLENENLLGLEDVVKYRMNDVEKNTTRVPYSALSKLHTLRSFTMKGGSLVLDRSDDTIPTLKTLELAAGDLKVVPSEAFINTPNIQTLMLWGNKINTIDKDAFKGLTNLVNVSLNSNNISFLPTTLFSFSPLTGRIDLYDNRLELLQEGLFKGLANLKEVIIFGNKANLTLEDTFTNLSSLTNLKLETSKIKELPDDLLRNSTSLKTLRLGGNELNTLPPSIFYDQKLIELYLESNNISLLPTDLLTNQTMLEKLVLKHNQLKDLNGLFTNAISLRFLDLSDNKIKKLSESSFNGAKNLKELYLTGNQIKYISSATFEFIILLEILSLARNNLTISEKENTVELYSPNEYNTTNKSLSYPSYYSNLQSLRKLKELYLSHNNVSLICEDWKIMVDLKKIDLSYNSITYLSDSSMVFDMTAVTVDVRHNKIKTIVPRIYEQSTLENVPTFLLDDNPFICDCYLHDFVESFTSKKNIPILKFENARCASPPSLYRTHISQLSPEVLSCDVPCDNCTCSIRPYNERLELDCPNLPHNLPDVPEVFKVLKYSNQIHLHTDTSFLPNYYKYVDMSNLSLTRAPSVESSMEINLANNLIKYAPLELFENNCTVYLSNNPLGCDCEDYENVKLLNNFKHLILDYNTITCRDGGLVSNINIKVLCVARDATIVGSSIALVCILSIIAIVVAYKYSIEIRILIDKYNPFPPKDFKDNKKYDAFLSYAHQDEEYVVEKLLPKLESGRRPLTLCVHYRNWIIGDFIPAQIARSVDESRKTIVVLSKHFINSVWGHMEFRTAHGKGRVIILMLDDLTSEEEKNLDPELKAYIAMNTYVKASDPLVFDRIRDAVLSKHDFQEKLSTGLNVQLKDGVLVNINDPDKDFDKLDVPSL